MFSNISRVLKTLQMVSISRKSSWHSLRLALATILISLVFAGLLGQSALAHTRVEVGPDVLIVGWENEPVIVGERNAI